MLGVFPPRSASQTRVQAFEAGADACALEPLADKELSALVTALLRRQRADTRKTDAHRRIEAALRESEARYHAFIRCRSRDSNLRDRPSRGGGNGRVAIR